MEKKEQLIRMLRSRGDKGLSSQDIVKKFKYTSAASGSKLIYLLRRDGHDIEFIKEDGIYVLHEEAVEVDTPDETEEVPTEEDSLTTPFIGTKKDFILNMLIKGGKDGVSTVDICDATGIKAGTVGYHMHMLRTKDRLKILNQNGRFFLKSKNVQSPLTDGSAETLGEPSETDKLMQLIGDRELVNGLKTVSPEDLDSYLDLVKKVAYYRQCALNLLNTSRVITGVRIESLSL